jgi:subtilisin family serine protease
MRLACPWAPRCGAASALLALAFAAVAVLVSSAHAGAPATGAAGLRGKISPELAARCRAAARDELIPVTIVMAEKADVDRLLPIARGLARAERRQRMVRELKRVSEVTQARVRDHLAAAAAQGDAAGIRPLWIGNGIRAELTPQAIAGLERFAEIRRVVWDRPIPYAESHDVVHELDERELPAPARAAGQAAGSDFGTIWWHLTYVHAPECWDLGYDGDDVVVAVLDSGIDRNHADLASHIWANPGELAWNQIDDDQNGYIDDTWGWNFEQNNNNPTYSMAFGGNHGTNCAGIVAGDGTSGTSTGVAPDALLMSCRVNTWGQNIEAIQYAIDNGADVISMSRSEKWRFNPQPDYDWWRSITDNELLTGIFHANSIGNEGDNQDTDPIPFNIAAPGSSPAPWRHPDQVQAGVSGIVSCGAVDQNDGIAAFSSIGPFAWEDIQAHWPQYPYDMRPEYQDYPWSGGLPGLLKPDLVAPGYNTRTTQINGGYIAFNGTSAATPHVAGAMAILVQANPNLTPEQMSMILETAATDLGPAGKDVTFGTGKLNCLAALEAALALGSIGNVSGTVTDIATYEPIADVLVEVTGKGESTTTDANGEYALALTADDYTLRFAHPSYVEAIRDVTVVAGLTITVDVALVPASAAVGEGADAGAAGGPATLAQNQPNPFNPATTIRFRVPETGPVTLAILDVHGRVVRRLVERELPPGEHAITWDGRDERGRQAPSGVYSYRLEAGGRTLTRRMALLK